MLLNDWIIFSLASILVGVGKVGFSGLSLVTVSMFASFFGKESVGVLLPLLVLADLTVYPAMRKYGSWREVWKLLPPALVGMVIGVVLLQVMPDSLAKPVIAYMILLMLGVILFKKWRPESQLHDSKFFAILAALGGGVSTVLANAAGPVIKIYLLSRDFPKMELVGISARFFLLINLLKLPLLGGVSLITKESLMINLRLAPFVLVGIWLGKLLLKYVPQKLFDFLIIVFAVIAAIRLLIF